MERIVEFYSRHARWVLLFAMALTLGSGALASRLTLDADLERLLPESAPSVQGLRDLETSYGIIGRVNVVLQGKDTQALQQAATKIAERVATIEGVERVEYTRPVEFFKQHRLLYLEYDDLEKVEERISKRLKWEKKQANPLFVSVKEEDPPEVDFSDIEARYDDLKKQKFYCSEAGDLCVVFVFPRFSASHLQKTRALLDDVRATADEVLSAEYPDVSFGLSGRYAKRIEQQDSLNRDLSLATMVAMISLFVFLLIYFRGFLAPLYVFVPLVMGTVWAFAWAQIVFGSLNILTSFFGAVLLGLGIDYGIHILSRFLEAVEEGVESPEQAMVLTLSSAGRASMYAGLTTVIAFGSLMTSSFRAFFEYGVIALGGMALLIIANVTVLPCILLLAARSRIQPRATMSVHLSNLVHTGEDDLHVALRYKKQARAGLVGLLVALFVFGAVGVTNTAFEYDFRNVQTTDLPSWRLDEHVDQILEVNQLPVIVLAESDAHAERVAAELRKRTEEMEQGYTMDRSMTLQDLLPKRQDDKLEIIRELEEQFERLPSRIIKDEIEEFYDEVRHVAEKGPLRPADLPEQVRVPFERRDSEDAAVVLAFPTIKQHDVRKMEDLAAIIRGLPGAREGETIDGINDSLLLVDIIDSVRRDSAWMLSITLLGLALTAFLAFRRRSSQILTLIATIGASMFVALGMVGLFEIKFNFINIVLLPIWIGLGVDAAFHLMVRHEESPGDLSGFLATALAVTAAFCTSMLGFGAMLVSSHNGLYSMGAVAVIGLGSILVTSLVVQGLVYLRTLRE